MTARDILQIAYEWIGELAVGESLDGAQIDNGLGRLNGILADMPQYGIGKRLKNVEVTGDLCAQPNTRNVVPVGTDADVTFPKFPGDGARVQIVTAITNATWIYRDDLGDWVLLQTLGLNDDSPYPPECDDTLAGLLAIRLAPAVNATLTPELQNTIETGLRHMKARYHQRVNTASDPALLHMSRQPYAWNDPC